MIILPFERNPRLHQFLVHLYLAPTVILIYPAASVSSPFSQVHFLSVLDFYQKNFKIFGKFVLLKQNRAYRDHRQTIATIAGDELAGPPIVS